MVEKRKRGRPRKSDYTPKKKGKVGRPRKEEVENDKNMVYLKCTICKKIREIHTNNPELYTDKLRKNYVCIFCK